METKAAKTLGIIVGGFIMCWLPFFTMYVVRAFCPNCIHPTVFSVLFWLGYCNSAINPCIYALFSKDFRFAFKRIICKCFCKRRANTLRRGSDGSQLAMRSVFFTVSHYDSSDREARAIIARTFFRKRLYLDLGERSTTRVCTKRFQRRAPRVTGVLPANFRKPETAQSSGSN